MKLLKPKQTFFMAFFAAALLSGCLSTSPVVTQTEFPDISGKDIPSGFAAYNRVVYEYNAKGQLEREVVLFEKGIGEAYTNVYEYNEAGFVIKKLIYNSKHNLDDYEIYELDAAGKKTREKEFRADGSLKNYKTYEYNDMERTVIKKFFDPKGILYRYSIKKIDETGRILEDSDYRK